MIRRALGWLADLVWPRKCVLCRRILEREPGYFCPACRRSIPPAQKGPKRGEGYSRCVSPCSYEGALRSSVLRFKFGHMPMYADAYAQLMAQTVRQELSGSYDLLSYVPLSRRRRRERGYDQAKLLAVALGRELGIPVTPLLRRVRHTGPQSGISDPAARRANIHNAYRVEKPAVAAGRRVLLVDDILTSGATLSEASRTLLQAGAADVVCVTLAVTPRGAARMREVSDSK